MKKIILALAATTALAAAMPAAAQTGGLNVNVRIGELRTQLQAGVQNGAITRAEAMPLREQLRQLEALERQYSVGGFTMQERSALQSRIVSLRQGIRMAGGNGDDRYDRGDRDDRWNDRDCPPGLERRDNGCLPPGQVGRDDRNGRWGDDDRRGDRIDRNRDGFDDRDLNRDGRIDANEWRMARDNDGRDGSWGDDNRRGDRIDRNRDGFDDRDLNRDGRIDANEWRMAGGHDGRDDDRDGRWDDDDRRGDRIDRNRDGYDDRDLNRDGRIDANEWRMAGDGRYDRDDDRDDDRYDDRRGGVGGVLDNLLGRNGLRVGQRVTASHRLGSVPYEYRNQYRDGNGTYYRSDGRAIYQIDARTDTVVRIYPLGR